MRKKTRILLASYLSITILALSLYAWAGQWGLGWYRRTANESANLAYEETVRSVQTLAAVLDRSPYATDSDMCDRICCEAYACACAAESAMATLPFSTWELEQLSAYLNTAGDYAHSLCGQGTVFSEGQRRELTELGAAADDFSQTLLRLREALQNRELSMDSREKRLRNVGTETGPLLSGELKDYEAGLQPLSLRYDGKYGGAEERKAGGLLTDAEMLEAAARFVELDPAELELAYEAEGAEGRRCYRAGDLWISVGRSGVENLSQSRLVGEESIDAEKARDAAESFLQKQGYEDLELLEESREACVAHFLYARVQDEALCPDCVLRVAIALDDGSVYAFDASAYDPEPLAVKWALDQEAARGALPEGLEERECRRLILKSPGGSPVPVYAFSCRDAEGRAVEICVHAETGKEYRITVEDPTARLHT